jgi:hypothetical protein
MPSRLQLALNVDDIGQAVAFYSKLFGAGPAKVRPGYANFAIAEPPLKLVLLENPARAAASTPAPSSARPGGSRRPGRGRWARGGRGRR